LTEGQLIDDRAEIYEGMTEKQLEKEGLTRGQIDKPIKMTVKGKPSRGKNEIEDEAKTWLLEIEDAREDGSKEREDEANKQIKKLERELRNFGRSKDDISELSSRFEKDRKAVWANINLALEKIRKESPDLFQHLDEYLHRKTSCYYIPQNNMDWLVQT
jgi:hypothetical protein